MKSLSELRALSSEELQAELIKLRREQFSLRMKKANGTLEKTHHVTKVRKLVAKVKTIMTEKAGE